MRKQARESRNAWRLRAFIWLVFHQLDKAVFFFSGEKDHAIPSNKTAWPVCSYYGMLQKKIMLE